MAEEDLEFRVNYPQFEGLRYVVIFTDQGIFLPMISAEAAHIAEIIRTPVEEKKKQLQEWRDYQFRGRTYEPFFTFEETFHQFPIKRKEGGGLIRKSVKLEDITAAQHWFGMQRKVKTATGGNTGSMALLKVGGDDAIAYGGAYSKALAPNMSGLNLYGHIKAKGRGSAKQRTKFDRTHIAGFLTSHKLPLSQGNCFCFETDFDSMKEGYFIPNLICSHKQALLQLADENPKLFRGFYEMKIRDPNMKVYLPIHTSKPQHKVLEEFTLHDKTYLDIKDQHRDLKQLKWDIFHQWVLKTGKEGTFFEIGKIASRIPVQYDISIARKIADNRASFGVIPRKFIFGVKSKVHPVVLQLYEENYEHLRKNGFVEKEYAMDDQSYSLDHWLFGLEKRGFEWETNAMIFENGDESYRLLFNEKFPPVVIKRVVESNHVVTPFRVVEGEAERVHPFAELHMPKYVYSDDLRRRTDYVVMLPEHVPKELWPDYKKAIDHYFKDEHEKLFKLAKREKVSRHYYNQLKGILSTKVK